MRNESVGRAIGLTTRALEVLALSMIGVYRAVLSPFLPPSCRFQPTCSQYMAQAIRRHGLWRGVKLGLARLARCHPWHPGGYDPVP
ncbi:MAG TPA: membrane protein insertion efficiency factor YidD [Limnochordia bacterium]